MPSKKIGTYSAVALSTVAIYLIAAFTRSSLPTDQSGWVTFTVVGLIVTIISTATVGTLVTMRGQSR
ncbi:hypothetical protein CHEID_01615 [Corynebacterium heidelbergense]|nr:hypothetical protein CHEID_01615 [Corynebacterium heidelbergense]